VTRAQVYARWARAYQLLVDLGPMSARGLQFALDESIAVTQVHEKFKAWQAAGLIVRDASVADGWRAVAAALPPYAETFEARRAAASESQKRRHARARAGKSSGGGSKGRLPRYSVAQWLWGLV